MEYQLRVEALRLAVAKRQDYDAASSIVADAQKFYDFLVNEKKTPLPATDIPF